MATKAKVEHAWMDLNVNSLEGDAKALFDAYKDQYRAMKAAREAFEAELSAMLLTDRQGQRVVFNYNFGKLSIAFADALDKPKAKGAVDLSTLIRRG